MLLVYTHKITPRITYIFKHAFEKMLEIPVRFTSAVEAFVAHSGPKMSYTTKPLGDEFFVSSHPLLFERGIVDHDLSIHDWEGTPAFFKTIEASKVPYDIFAASFYLLTRYEESVPALKTRTELFGPSQSIAMKGGFLEVPVVDLWIFKMHQIMSANFAEIEPYKKKASKKELLVDVPLAFKYRHRSFLVVVETFFKSIWRFNLLKILNQLMVLFRLEEDPYDSFESWNNWFEDSQLAPKIFFRYANSSAYESNVSTFNGRLQSRIKKAGDGYPLGLLLSVQSQLKPDLSLNEEKKGFQQLTHRQLKMSRIPRSFRQLSKVYADLVDFEFTDDFSMGYPDQIGFRAGTSVPFYFYDLTNEFQLPLKVHPVVACETAIREGKSVKVFATLESIFQNFPLTCSRLTLAVSNGFLHHKKENLPLQKEFKDFIK